MNNFDLIATLDIDITQKIAEGQCFDNMLIVGPAPKVAPETAPAPIADYTSLAQVTAAGFVSDGENADPIGVAAKVAFSQKPEPSKIYIAVIQKDETATQAVTRAVNTAGWWAVCPAGIDKTEYANIAAFIETQEKFFCYTELDFFTAEKHTASVSGTHFRTLGIFARETSEQQESDIPEANKYMNVAFIAKWFSYRPGSETTAYKALSEVVDAKLSTAEMKELDEANLNYYVSIGNRKLTVGGKVIAGEWADVIRFRDWLKNDMQSRVVDLFATNPRVPFTDAGIAAVQNQMLASLKAGQDVGGIAEEAFDADGGSIPGYTTSVPLASSMSATQKASRKMSGFTFKARLASAIHLTELDGTLTYEL